MRTKIRDLRRRLGLSQEKAAHAAGISTRTWIMVEQGRRNPSVEVARRIAGALGTSIDELFS